MANTPPNAPQNDGTNSGGMSKSGTIAIATALITAGTTISVAYITKSSPDSGKATSAPAAPPAGSPASAPPAAPASTQPSTAVSGNISGQWRNPQANEELYLTVNGSQLQVQWLAPAMELNVMGYGTATADRAQWSLQIQNAMGQTASMTCQAQVVGVTSLQGTCTNNLGQKSPFMYIR